MDFGLSDGYKVLDGLDQGEVFSPLLWRIFYDPLLCEVARQNYLCGYQINSNFVSKTERIETSGGMTFFFAAGAFVDDTIWVGNGQASMQHIFNVASEFFLINNININNEKTIAIFINKRVGVPVLSINSQAITVANPGPNFAKANSDIKFFLNMVLWKAVSDKQFFYLVSAVLQSIVSYRMQFSFVSKAVCLKWDILIRRGLRSKANLSRDFPNEVLHHPSLYGLKSFEQLQAECKTASVVQFANSSRILGRLFKHRILDLQVLCWALLNPLQYLVKLRVNTSNNFLVDVVCIFLDNKLSLDNRLPCAFHSSGHFPMSLVLGDLLYFNVVCSLKIAGVAYGDQLLNKNSSIKRLGSRGPVPLWFLKAFAYLSNCLHAPPPVSLASVCASVLDSTSFADIREEIYGLWTDEIDVVCGAAVYFPGLNKGLGAEVHGVLSLTLAELQAVVLVLECVPASVSVALYMNNQAAIDACVAELGLLQPDCRNSCWIERCHVVNLIESKDLTVRWIKVKGYAGIAGNVLADVLAEQAAHSGVSLPARINCRYIVADDRPVSGNACHFVRDIFHSICKFQWKMGSGQGVVSCLFGLIVNWNSTTLVWHPDSHMLSGSTCRATAAFHTYFIKAVHFRLPVADDSVQSDILGDFGGLWRALMGPNLLLPSFVLQDLSLGVSDIGLYSVFCKGFVLKSWMDKATASLGDKKKAAIMVVDFICHLAESHRTNLWLFRTKFKSDMERSGLIGDDVVVASALGVGALPFSAGMVHLIGVLDSLDVGFGFRGRFLFLSGAVHRVSVLISV
ncbi:hypothetical protein G9A89_021975 [Geosiphon pyriformis]|nr:hypothetical protein G9A89_021975 [Geosiphon pyriformis]